MANKDLPKSKRIFYIDAIRAIAILLVILCHIANEYPLVNTSLITAIPFFTKDVSRIGVPLFFMISGALLLGRDYPSLKSFIEKRFTRIAYPFIFWIMIYIILCFALNIDAHYLLPIL